MTTIKPVSMAEALRRIDNESVVIMQRLWQLKFTYGEEPRSVAAMKHMSFIPRLVGEQPDDKKAFQFYTPEYKLHVLKVAVARLDVLREELRFLESKNEQGQLINRLRDEFGIVLTE